MRVLLVEDEKDLASIVKMGLEEEGYVVDVAYDGEEGLYMAENYPLDAIILDVMLPVMDGLTLLSTIRKKGIKTPVLVLTARDALMDKIEGLDTGADDYMTKPFEFSEMVARLRALIRRTSEAREAVLRVGDLEINTASHEVKRAGQPIKLSAREYALLEYLLRNPERVILTPIAIETSRIMHPWNSAIVVPPTVLPRTIVVLLTGVMSISFIKPNCLSHNTESPENIAEKRSVIPTIPGVIKSI